MKRGGDGLLRFNDERPIFLRRNGRLVFNSDYKLHRGNTEALMEEEVPFPYEWQPLPVI